MSEVLQPTAYAALHKKAFREAFDFLNAHFPPGADSAWWGQAWEDVKQVLERNRGNTLLGEMLQGVIAYLEEESKVRREEVGA